VCFLMQPVRKLKRPFADERISIGRQVFTRTSFNNELHKKNAGANVSQIEAGYIPRVRL